MTAENIWKFVENTRDPCNLKLLFDSYQCFSLQTTDIRAFAWLKVILWICMIHHNTFWNKNMKYSPIKHLLSQYDWLTNLPTDNPIICSIMHTFWICSHELWIMHPLHSKYTPFTYQVYSVHVPSILRSWSKYTQLIIRKYTIHAWVYSSEHTPHNQGLIRKQASHVTLSVM